MTSESDPLTTSAEVSPKRATGRPLRVGTANRRDWYLVPLDALGSGCHADALEDATP